MDHPARSRKRARASRRLATAILLASALGSYSCARGDPFAVAERHAREILDAYMKTTRAPGLQIAVGVDGRIVWSAAFGLADRKLGEPVTPASRFRIASISKLLTGTLAAKLADAGTLDPDRPIGEYVDDLPEAWRPITADMLLHHTSGIAHYTDRDDALDTTHYSSTREALSRFRDRPLAHPPDQAETYSSYAYTVLALAIEKASGRPFLDVMSDEILKPLGMTRTGPDMETESQPDRTAFYEMAEDGSVQDAPYLDLSGRWAGSGYLSTAEDLVRFGLAHTKPGVFSAGTLALVGRRRKLPDGSLTKEGFGWGPREDWDGEPMLFGDGSTPGSRCGLLVYPQRGVAIAILTNARGLPLERGELQLLARLFLAVQSGQEILPAPPGLAGRWSGSVKAGGADLQVHATVRPSGDGGRGRVTFERWRSFDIVDIFRLKETTWLVPLDGGGFFPVTLAGEDDSLQAEAPRADLSFRLERSADPEGEDPARP